MGYFDLGYSPHYPNDARVYNNISYANGIGIAMAINETYSGQNPGVYKNNIIYGTRQIDAAGRPYNLSVTDFYLESHNTWDFADSSIVGSLPWWQPTDTVTVTDDDFLSLDQSQLTWPRNADGSLPEITFMHPDPSSDLIDAGVDVGLPYIGNSPDIGFAEFTPTVNLNTPRKVDAGISVFPNPTDGMIWIRSNKSGHIHIRLLELSGKELFSESINLSVNSDYPVKLSFLNAGLYLLDIRMGDEFKREKLIIR